MYNENITKLAFIKSKNFKQEIWRQDFCYKKNFYQVDLNLIVHFLENKLKDNNFLKEKQATMRCENSEKTYHPASYQDIKEGWYNGLSLQIRQLQHQLSHENFLVDLARKLEEILLQPLESITLFISPPNAQAAPRHYDNSEIFTIQLMGQKNWQFFYNSLSKEPIKSIVIEPNSLLYVPARLPHQVKSENCFSISAALIFEPICYNLIARFLDEQLIAKNYHEISLPVMGDHNSKAMLKNELIPILQAVKSKINQMNDKEIANFIKKERLKKCNLQDINLLNDFVYYKSVEKILY